MPTHITDVDEETRAIIEELTSKMRDGIVLSESMTDGEAKLLSAIKDYIQGSVLLSFLETRRQLKAVQRELADLRKQYDKDVKQSRDLEAKQTEKIEKILKVVEGMQGPVDKGAQPVSQSKLYDLMLKMAKRVGLNS